VARRRARPSAGGTRRSDVSADRRQDCRAPLRLEADCRSHGRGPRQTGPERARNAIAALLRRVRQSGDAAARPQCRRALMRLRLAGRRRGVGYAGGRRSPEGGGEGDHYWAPLTQAETVGGCASPGRVVVSARPEVAPVPRTSGVGKFRRASCDAGPFRAQELRFVPDSPLEGAGFEPSVPGRERMIPFWRRRSGEWLRRRQEAVPRR
jgi:hypothetical protein